MRWSEEPPACEPAAVAAAHSKIVTAPGGAGRRIVQPGGSRRNGLRVNASTAAITVRTPTMPEMARLPNSTRAWVLSGGSGMPSHLGQFEHPTPE